MSDFLFARACCVAMLLLAGCLGCEAETVDSSPVASADLPLLPPAQPRRVMVDPSRQPAVAPDGAVKTPARPAAEPPVANQRPAARQSPIIAGRVEQDDPVQLPAPSQAGNGQAANRQAAAGRQPDRPQVEREDKPLDNIEDLLQQVEPGVVRVDIRKLQGIASGSGVLLTKNGIIATNEHVVEGAISGKVTFNDKATAIIRGVVARMPGKDLVFLKIESPPATAVPVTLAREARRGERVVAIGASHGLAFTVSEGIISGLRSGDEIADSFQIQDLFNLDQDSEWVQTTAPISPGNSGGPLLNMHGELVGLNTFSRVGAQNMNFAISHTHVARLLKTPLGRVVPFADLQPEPLAGLPGPADPPRGKAPRGKGGPIDAPRQGQTPFGTIPLSDGGTLFEAAVNLSSQEIDLLSEMEGVPYVEEHPGGALAVLASWKGGKLHGFSCRVSPEGRPLQLMAYQAGKRDGTQRTWAESGKREYFAEFKNDRPHGLKCLFRDDLPWLIQVSELGKVQADYLVQYKAGLPEALHRDKWGDDLKPLGELALESLQKYEAQLATEEVALRKEFRTWYREASDKEQRAVLAHIAPRRNANNRAQQKERAQNRREYSAGLAREIFRIHNGP